MEPISAGSQQSNTLNAAVNRKKAELERSQDANIAEQVKKEEASRETEKDLDTARLREEAIEQSRSSDEAIGKNLDITS